MSEHEKVRPVAHRRRGWWASLGVAISNYLKEFLKP